MLSMERKPYYGPCPTVAAINGGNVCRAAPNGSVGGSVVCQIVWRRKHFFHGHACLVFGLANRASPFSNSEQRGGK